MNHEEPSDGQPKIGIVLLAAGASRRMGTPKQLLKVNGISLIRHATEQALNSGCRPVVVVLGANAALIVPELHGLAIDIAVNGDWKSGMSSSIRCGLNALLATNPHLEGVVLFVADQPQVTGTSLQKLLGAHAENHAELVAASYSNTVGTPALFSRLYFKDLLEIEEQGGAKSVLRRYASRVLAVDFPEGAWDLDRPEDFANFAKREKFHLQMRQIVKSSV